MINLIETRATSVAGRDFVKTETFEYENSAIVQKTLPAGLLGSMVRYLAATDDAVFTASSDPVAAGFAVSDVVALSWGSADSPSIAVMGVIANITGNDVRVTGLINTSVPSGTTNNVVLSKMDLEEVSISDSGEDYVDQLGIYSETAPVINYGAAIYKADVLFSSQTESGGAGALLYDTTLSPVVTNNPGSLSLTSLLHSYGTKGSVILDNPTDKYLAFNKTGFTGETLPDVTYNRIYFFNTTTVPVNLQFVAVWS